MRMIVDVAGQLRGSTIPTGNIEFQFKAGNLNFKSTEYQWLVVSGARAQFKGWGTINGAGAYGFMLTAIDGQVSGGGDLDRFRIKIWDAASEVIVYDNQAGTDDTGDLLTDGTLVQGGSIVIHSRSYEPAQPVKRGDAPLSLRSLCFLLLQRPEG
jgi:hypothetical protein